ncbi:MAG TPA: hypothetical protein VMB02_14635 [Candidatus Aquilonibacter sp.]|nr:hypothetical protein [Candidatus Aquilonibacter sp.]
MGAEFDHTHSADSGFPSGHLPQAVQVISTLHNDPRLLVGAGTVASHAAEQAGFSEQAQQDLGTATTEACDEVFGMAEADSGVAPAVSLTATRFLDRVEIRVELSTSGAKHGSKRMHGHDGRPGHERLEDGLVDHVQRETHEGRPSIMLVKYARTTKSKA